VQGPRKFPQVAVQIGWLHAVNHGIQIFVRGAETLEDGPQRIGVWTVGLRPPRSQLNTGDRIVTTADSDAIASVAMILVVTAIVAAIAADIGPLTCAHTAQL
jgi:hypothetical protein